MSETCQSLTNMETSSYLFMSKKQQLIISSRKMEKQSNFDSSISTDSLEMAGEKKTRNKDGAAEERVDTILVPFYEKDVLIKVPIEQKKVNKKDSKTEKSNQLPHPNYLINKTKTKRTSYLEMFRKQFLARGEPEKPPDEYEISSLMPEYGDTERESIGEEVNNPDTEYYDTEAYNEAYYDKILQDQLNNSLENSFEEGLRFEEDISKTPEENEVNNLRSVSEVSHAQQRKSRRATAEPLPNNVKLGGLGADIEHIKPRLERARSLQRYSEKVRMENRLRIYKKTLQAEMEKKRERLSSAQRRETRKDIHVESENNASYLMNKKQEQQSQIAKKIKEVKCKSAGLLRGRDKGYNEKKSPYYKKEESNHEGKVVENTVVEKKPNVKYEEKTRKESAKVFVKSRPQSKAINTEMGSETFGVPPVHISFMVNVGGTGVARPPSALKTLEEKHRMYQEQVKAFNLDKVFKIENDG